MGDTNRSLSLYGDYGAEGYRIKNFGSKLSIGGENSRGIIYGVYRWLESVGFGFYNESATVVPDINDIYVTDIDISYEPAFDYREVMYKGAFDVDWAVSNGINGDFFKWGIAEKEYGGYVGFIGETSLIQNSIGPAPAIVPHTLIGGYPGAESHPEYFAVDENGVPYASDYTEYKNTQVCLSNAGALATAKAYAVARISSVVYSGSWDRQSLRLWVSVMDNNNYCKCSGCQALYAEYGTGGAWLRWVNEIAKYVKNSGFGSIYIETLAYNFAKDIPVGVVPEDNVIVRFCSSFGGAIKDRNDSDALTSEMNALQGWLNICDNVEVYYYTVDFCNYMEIFPNFDDMYYNVKEMYERGVKGVYFEGFFKNNGEFGELRSFLAAKLMQYPDMTIEEYHALISDFCDGYYGAAGVYVKNYIDAVKAAMTDDIKISYLADNNKINFTAALKTACEGYWNSAESAVSGDAVLLARVQKSRLHWTYAMLVNYESDYNSGAYNVLAYNLSQKMVELNVKCVAENAVIYTESLIYYDYMVKPSGYHYGLSNYNPINWHLDRADYEDA